MAQLSSCHSRDSQDSKKSCFFIYSIYWYKDSSLRDIGNVTSGLWWPWCGNLSRHGNRSHMTCKSFFDFSWDYYTNVATTLGLLWSSNEERHTHSDTQPHTRPDEKAQSRGRRKFQMCNSHTTALWIIELSCSSWSTLWCAHSESLTCQTLQYTHIHGYKLFLCMFLKLEQMGLSMECLSLFLVVWNSEASTCLSPSQLRQRRHLLITDMHNPFVLLHISCYPNRWHWRWGWMIKLCYYLCHDFILPWLADSGRHE